MNAARETVTPTDVDVEAVVERRDGYFVVRKAPAGQAADAFSR